MKRLRPLLKTLSAATLLAMICQPLANAAPKPPAPAPQQRLATLFHRWQTHTLDLPELHRRAHASGRLQLTLGEQTFDLELEPNDLRAPNVRQVLNTRHGELKQADSEVATFKGRVAGDPESVVRLLILPDLIQGYIRTKEDWYFIDPLYKYVKGAPPAEVVAFKKGDVRAAAAKLCGAGELADVAAKLQSDEWSFAELSYGPRSLYLATEADYEYYSIYGANTNSQIQGVLNQVDGIYQNYLSITISTTYQGVWTTSADPYSSSDPNTLLSQFKSYWNTNRKSVWRNVAHLFTGRTLINYIGIAYTSTVCNSPSNAYGLSQDYPLMVKLVAHEIGHNLGAAHDNQVSPPADSCTGTGPIMCSALQSSGPEAFSSRSVSDISTHASRYHTGSCLVDEACAAQCHADYDVCAQYGCEYGDCSQCYAMYQGCLGSC